MATLRQCEHTHQVTPVHMNQTTKLGIYSILIFCTTYANADWQYRSHTDKMTDSSVTFSTLESNNSLSLGFPYQGSNYGTITIRKKGRASPDVYVSVNKGQILCNAWDNCSIKVRFDSSQALNFRGAPPADHSSNTVFLSPEKKFVDLASKSTKILIELPMFQAGNQTLEFFTSSKLSTK